MKNYPKPFLPIGAAGLLALLAPPAVVASPVNPQKDGTTVAKVIVVDGALLGRTTTTADWQPFKTGTAVSAGTLLVALPDAQLLSPNGAVRLRMLADLGKRGPFPVFESAVRLNSNDKVDLDFAL